MKKITIAIIMIFLISMLSICSLPVNATDENENIKICNGERWFKGIVFDCEELNGNSVKAKVIIGISGGAGGPEIYLFGKIVTLYEITLEDIGNPTGITYIDVQCY
jgi:hypothetical protein